MKHRSKYLFNSNRLKDLIIIFVLYILGIIIVIITKPSYLFNILIVYLPGLIYTFLRIQKSRNKILLFTLCSLLFIIPVEVLARTSNSWDVLSIFPRINDIAPIENMVYGIINIIYPLTFYELFYDYDRNRKISNRWKYLILIYLSLFIFVFLIYPLISSTIILDYWIIGIAILLPVLALLLIFKKHILKRLLIPALVFGLMYFIHEIVSMSIGHWWWPGNYLLPITIDGLIYPLEDFIIWILFSNIAVISGYEVMWD